MHAGRARESDCTVLLSPTMADTGMHYTRRPTWPDQPARRDYIIQREDLQIGRV